MSLPPPDLPVTGSLPAPSAVPAPGSEHTADFAAAVASARPALVRRAPRYRSFFWTGALVGIVVGIILGLTVSDAGMINRWIYVVVMVLGSTLVTTLLAGLLAVLSDRRSAR